MILIFNADVLLSHSNKYVIYALSLLDKKIKKFQKPWIYMWKSIKQRYMWEIRAKNRNDKICLGY